MTRKLLLGSNNSHKRDEIRKVLAGLDISIVTPREAGVEKEPEENGTTFLENAVAKALYYAKESGLLTLADDSGLEVDALDGRPGVWSARYAGEDASDSDNLLKLLDELKDVPDNRRSARFQCVVAVADREGLLADAAGACSGFIIREPRGTSGFGYDPVFLYPPEGRTFAELSEGIKNRVSHRAAALQAIREKLVSLIG